MKACMHYLHKFGALKFITVLCALNIGIFLVAMEEKEQVVPLSWHVPSLRCLALEAVVDQYDLKDLKDEANIGYPRAGVNKETSVTGNFLRRAR